MLRVADFLEDQQVLRSPDAPLSPAVSVVLPTYRRCASGQLRRAIESVLAQSFGDLELLVMDDGSTDGSADLIDRLRGTDPRVVHVRHERNCGLPGLRVNEGIELARGRYLAFQFDDDTWRPLALKALVEALGRLGRPGLAIGRALFTAPSGQWVLPAVELSLVTLYDQNRFANNCVLFPRDVLNSFGMYDPHIAMRRLCDWDLWLRLIKHLPFVVIDEIISDVRESNPDSIGATVPWDLALFRYLHDIPRDALLTPARWHQYQVDALAIGDISLAKDFRRRVWAQHVVPYYLRFRTLFPSVEAFRPSLPAEPKTALYTKNSYDVSNDVTLNHFDGLAHRRGSYKSHFQLLGQVTPAWTSEADALLLVRVVEDEGKELAAQALAAGVPLGFYLDDDLLTFHEFGQTFDYLAPGTPHHRNLVEMLAAADAVWVTNHFISSSVAPHNARIVTHSNCVPVEYVATDPAPRDPARPLRIGYAGTGYRREEFRLIWEALVAVSRRYGNLLRFEFWGFDVTGLPPLGSPIAYVPFTFSYFEYLARLREAHFDIALCPLLDRPTPRLGKSLIKYFEAAVAGAVGVFSDVPQYAALPGGLTCVKSANDSRQWEEALAALIEMPRSELDAMRHRCVSHVREEYANTALIDRHEAAWRATELHALTRGQRHADGRPRVAYFLHSAILGGGEIQLWRRLRLAREYGIAPVVVLPSALRGGADAARIATDLEAEGIQLEFAEYTCFDVPKLPADFTSDQERNDVRDLLRRCRPALVHSVTFIPSVGQVCRELAIPHVASMYQVEVHVPSDPTGAHCTVSQSDSLRYTERWAELLGTTPFCAREVAPADIFQLGFERSVRRRPHGEPWRTGPIRLVMTGTLQPRKQQAEVIEAVGRLRQSGLDCRLDLYGYSGFFTDYSRRCQRLITEWGLEHHVDLRGFETDMRKVLSGADVLVSVSTSESFPSALKEAMAAGLLVVATPIGGIPELVVDGKTGILCTGTEVEAIANGIRRAAAIDEAVYRQIVEAARRVARAELHPNRAANDLMTMYVKALEQHRSLRSGAMANTLVPGPHAVPAEAPPLTMVQLVGAPPLDYLSLRWTREYTLLPRFDNLRSIAVLLGSPLEEPVSVPIIFELSLPDGQVLRKGHVESSVRGASGRWVELTFPPLAHSAGQPLRLAIRLASSPVADIGIFEIHHKRSLRERIELRLGVEGARPFAYAKLLSQP